MTETIGSAMSSRKEGLFASLASMRWGQAIILLSVFAAIVMTAVYSYRAIDRELTESALSRRAALSYLAAAVLAEKFDRLVDIGISLATRVRFRELVEAGNWTEAIKILSRVPADFPFVDRITLIDLRGTLMADVPETPVRGQNFAYRNYYQAVMRNGQPYISQVYRRVAPPQMNVFAAAVPIKSGKGEMLGLLVVHVRSDTFFEWTRGVDVRAGGLIFVVDHEGTLAFHPKFPPQGDLIDYSGVPAVQQVLRGKRGVEIEFNPVEGEERVAAYEPITKHGWGVVLAQPTAIVFATRDDQLRRVLIAYGLILIFVICVAYLASRIVIQRRQADEDRRMKTELEKLVQQRTAELTEQTEKLRAVLETVVDAIITIDERGRIESFNPAAERQFGYAADEVIGKNVNCLMPEPHAGAHDGYLQRYLQTRQARVVGTIREVEARRKDGMLFHAELGVSETGLDGRRFFTGIMRDITERKRTEAQLLSANKELESFSYSVSHDLRSPLRAIDGYSQIVEEDYAGKLDEEGRRLLGVIRESSQRMGTLIDDLLGFSQLGRKPMAVVEIDMSALVKEVLLEHQTSGGGRPPQIRVANLPTARGDRTLLKQVWDNLLLNAIKFTSKNDDSIIEVRGNNDGAESIYSVKDNGVGFDMQYYHKLFGVFQRLHSADEFRGTGVGLAIVQRIITRHGGRVWAEGKLNEGAAFFFALPLGEKNV